jgi:hypothetical protein
MRVQSLDFSGMLPAIFLAFLLLVPLPATAAGTEQSQTQGQ